MDYVYKILRVEEWTQLQDQGQFPGSAHDLRDGFIHLATEDQVQGVIQRYFNDENTLYVLKCATKNFRQEKLKWEKSKSNEELFPHLYGGTLKTSHILEFKIFTKDVGQ